MYNWKDNWEIVASGLGGGQGDCFKVNRKNEKKAFFFLKVSKDIKNKERRRRFYIETLIYKSVNINGLPKIIETNSHLFEDVNTPLYYVSEYIDGLRLDRFVNSKNLNESEIINLFKQLLKIVADCHSCDIVHRDIKPENIIIKDDKLYLVDFGISYFEGESLDNTTKLGQEIGNRFLRLPEHSGGSLSKRESISDLTMVLGIALFLISNKYPRKLVSENGEYPHQLKEVSDKIDLLLYSKIWNLLFDKGFQQRMNARWGSSSEIIKIVNTMSEKKEESENFKELLRIHSEQLSHDDLYVIEGGLKDVQSNMEVALNYILNTQAMGFEHTKQGWVYVLGDVETKSQVTTFPIGKSKNTLWIIIKTKLIGEQVIGFIEIDEIDFEIIRISLGTSLRSKRVSDRGHDMIIQEIEKIVLPELVKLL